MREQMAAETKANVLLVDDKPENLLALEAILADLGQNLIGATSAREALRVLLLEDVALILLDVQMPGLSGFELAELIRERERTQHTPIIFVTANNSDEEYVFKGYALGAVDYLTKPIQPEILKSKVSFFSRLFLQQQVIRQKSKELEEANERLDAMNVELEERVRQRTSDLESEVDVRRQSEARLATEHSITRSLAGAASVDAAAPDILRAFIENMNAAIAAMWELSPDGRTLECSRVEVAAAEAASVATFAAETRKAKFIRGVGLPGRVWETREPIWLPNTLRGEKYPRAVFAATAGLDSAIGFPVTVGSELYCVIEFLTRDPLMPNRELMNMLDAIGSEIGQFIQRKRVEEERIRLLQREKALREQAEAANRLKDEFLATVSHELRTPLNSILGWSKLVLQDMVDADAVHSALETIHRNATLQAQLIEDLLDASRLITGKLLLNLSPTQIAPVIEAAVNMVRPKAEDKNVSLDFSHDDRISVVTADQSRLQQMVLNLLTNAVKFTPDGGRVSIRTERKGDVAQIVVSDTGVGISADFLPYVFDRFRQQDSSSTRRHDGLGLGLAIVSHLAELHGGSVTADSRGVGEGSTFVISLPLTASAEFAEPTEPETITSTTTANGLNGVRIHVVDDDEDACQMLKFALGLQGAEVETSRSAATAIAAIEERCPDILLADLNMPGEDGYSLIKKVRNLHDRQASAMPAIALTAMARTEDTERVLSAGFQLHVPKPVEIDELAASIAQLLGREPKNGTSAAV
jgi:signal transduction histidine kinase/DNA-binding response OmpR family regulator